MFKIASVPRLLRPLLSRGVNVRTRTKLGVMSASGLARGGWVGCRRSESSVSSELRESGV